MKIKAQQTISDNYKNSGGRASVAYKAAIPGAPFFEKATSATAESNYGTGVSAAVVGQRRLKGLQAKTSQADWENMAITKGATNINTGITAAAPKQAKGYAPYYSLATSTTLAPRGMTGDENVTNRLLPWMHAQEALKKQIKG